MAQKASRASAFAALLVLSVSLTSLSAKAAIEFDDKVPAGVKKQITQDLAVARALSGGASSHLFQAIFGANTLDGAALLQFFTDRITSIGLNACGGGTGVAACVIPQLDPHKMNLTNFYLQSSIPQIYRLSVVFHESRHSEDQNDNWMHINCPIPFIGADGKDVLGIISGTKMEGKPACDNTAMGAYGLQAVLLKNVQHACTVCGDKVKMDAQLFGDDTIKRIVGPAHDTLANDLAD